MTRNSEVFDLGGAVARLEEAEDGGPFVTFLAPAGEDLPPQQIQVWGDCRGLIELGRRISAWQAKMATPAGSSASAGLTIDPF